MRNALWFGKCCVCMLIASATLYSHSVSAASSKEATFYAWDHRFEGPETIPAGQTTVRLRNRGKEPHQLQFLKLDAGKTPAELAAALQSGTKRIPSWAKQMGGPNGVGAGKAAEATLYLEPGSYVIICGMPGNHQQTHAALGMQKALRVIDTNTGHTDRRNERTGTGTRRYLYRRPHTRPLRHHVPLLQHRHERIACRERYGPEFHHRISGDRQAGCPACSEGQRPPKMRASSVDRQMHLWKDDGLLRIAHAFECPF
ncbi:MAG: uncharacterized protein K0S79_2979 [Nitrospira sp.]|nr:uncharacterized protein [Nitrospira sp.]